MPCTRGALRETVPDETFREELEAKFFKLADWVRNQPTGNEADPKPRLEFPNVFLDLARSGNLDAAQGIILQFHSQAAHGDLEDLCRVRPIALAMRQCFQDVIAFDIRKRLPGFVKSHAAAPSLTKKALRTSRAHVVNEKLTTPGTRYD